MSLIKVTAEELESVSSQLGASAAAINDENSKALGMVNGLVGAGWEGAASAQFHTYATTEDHIKSAMQ